jgi:two-component system chemotaxis response regulator CheY
MPKTILVVDDSSSLRTAVRIALTGEGYDVVEAMKQNPSYKYTPVVMLTTESGDDKKERGKAAGAKAWIVKPFQPPQLLKVVSTLVMP